MVLCKITVTLMLTTLIEWKNQIKDEVSSILLWAPRWQGVNWPFLKKQGGRDVSVAFYHLPRAYGSFFGGLFPAYLCYCWFSSVKAQHNQSATTCTQNRTILPKRWGQRWQEPSTNVQHSVKKPSNQLPEPQLAPHALHSTLDLSPKAPGWAPAASSASLSPASRCVVCKAKPMLRHC